MDNTSAWMRRNIKKITHNSEVTGTSNIYICDCTDTQNFVIAITGSIADIRLSNVPTSCEIFLELTTTGTTTMSWTLNGGSLVWAGGVTPASLGAGKTYRFMLFTKNGGTKWEAYAAVGV